jgi:uncharacterized Zn finger protein (UPF0148 family)
VSEDSSSTTVAGTVARPSTDANGAASVPAHAPASAPVHAPAHPPLAPLASGVPLQAAPAAGDEMPSSPIAAANRAWRRFKGAPPIPLDDRGNPIRRAERATLVDAMRDEGVKVAFPWRQFFQWTVPIILLAWFVASRFAAIKTVLPLFFVWPLISLISAARSRRGDNVPLALRERIADGSMLRAGRCAACGFSLRDIEVRPDGCVVCPECAAAWHQDRWRVWRDDAPALAGRGVSCTVKSVSAARQVDDRGALLTEPMTSRPKWLKAMLTQSRNEMTKEGTPPHRASFITALRAARRQTLIWTLIPATLLILAVAAIIVAANTDVLFTIAPFLALGVGVAAIATVMIVRHRGLVSVDVRTLALTHNVCPACGESIDPAAPRDFDGCVRCASCAGAWRFNALGQPAKRHRAKATFAFDSA